MCSILAGWLQASCFLDCHGLVSEFDFAPAFEGLLSERPLTLTMYCIRAGIVEEIIFADGKTDCWLVATSTVAVRTQVARVGHRATRDFR